MRVAKYWRNNKLRYRLIKSAACAGQRAELKPQSTAKRPMPLRRAAAFEAEKV